MQHEIAIIGPKDVILGFKAIGVCTYFSENPKQTLEILQRLKNETLSNSDLCRYAIIFIMESDAKTITQEDYKRITADALPAIIALPGPEGSTGFGLERLGTIVEKAIGSNILKD